MIPAITIKGYIDVRYAASSSIKLVMSGFIESAYGNIKEIIPVIFQYVRGHV